MRALTIEQIGGFALVAMLVLGVFAAPTALADNDDELEVEFKFGLSGDEEVPAVTTDAFGLAEVELKVKGDAVTLKVEVEVCDIERVTQSHIHASAPRGENAGVVLFLFGRVSDAEAPSFEDCTRLMKNEWTKAELEASLVGGFSVQQLIDAIVSGNAYINVHTVANPPGEIRGQIE